MALSSLVSRAPLGLDQPVIRRAVLPSPLLFLAGTSGRLIATAVCRPGIAAARRIVAGLSVGGWSLIVLCCQFAAVSSLFVNPKLPASDLKEVWLGIEPLRSWRSGRPYRVASRRRDEAVVAGRTFVVACRKGGSDWTGGGSVPTVESERRVAIGVNQILSIHANNLGEGVSIRAGADLMLVPDQTH